MKGGCNGMGYADAFVPCVQDCSLLHKHTELILADMYNTPIILIDRYSVSKV